MQTKFLFVFFPPTALDCTIGFSIPQVNGFPESDPNGADACIILTGTTDVSTFVRVVSGAIGDTATRELVAM